MSTTLLQRTLAVRGFAPEGWRQGINTGANSAKLRRLEHQIAALHAATGEKVILIG